MQAPVEEKKPEAKKVEEKKPEVKKIEEKKPEAKVIAETSSKAQDGPPGKVKDSHGKYYDNNGQKKEKSAPAHA